MSLIISATPTAVVVTVGVAFRDEDWSARGGEFQAEVAQADDRAVTVDLSETEWADPIPLLQLAMLLCRHRARRGANFINLGRPRDSSGNRFPIFLVREGFLPDLIDQAIIFWDGE